MTMQRIQRSRCGKGKTVQEQYIMVSTFDADVCGHCAPMQTERVPRGERCAVNHNARRRCTGINRAETAGERTVHDCIPPPHSGYYIKKRPKPACCPDTPCRAGLRGWEHMPPVQILYNSKKPARRSIPQAFRCKSAGQGSAGCGNPNARSQHRAVL